MTSQPKHSGHEITNQASLTRIPDSGGGEVWPSAEYGTMVASNDARCPKPIAKERRARHRAAVTMLEKIESIRDELGKIHILLLNQAGPDGEYTVQVYKYYLKLSNFLQNEADNFLVYEETNTGIDAVDADIEGLAMEHDLAITMHQAALLAERCTMTHSSKNFAPE